MGYNIFSFFNPRFLIELFYNKYIARFVLGLGGQTTKVLDKAYIELLGPYGLEKGLLILSKSLSSLDTGLITSYALYILIALIFYILISYISLIDVSILLCIIFGLLNISVNTLYFDICIGLILKLKSNIPQPHPSIDLPLLSNLFKFFSIKVSVTWFTLPLVISQIISIGMCLGYIIPIRFMLGVFDLLLCYPFFNVIITLCAIAIISNINGNSLRSTELYMKGFLLLFVPLLVWYITGLYHDL